MKRDPLWRNQAELNELVSTRLILDPYMQLVVTDHGVRTKCMEMYIIPALEKTYRVNLREMEPEERVRMAVLLMERGMVGDGSGGGAGGVVEQERTWSLGVPEKEEEFMAWMNDERTGKPVRLKDRDQMPLMRGNRPVGRGKQDKSTKNEN